MFVIVVFFEIKAAHVAEFKEAITVNAKASVDNEPGCQLFDVAQAPEDETSFFLYEIYDDEDAFKAHLEAEHFKSFDALCAPWVKDKKVLTYGLIAKNRS